MTKKEMLDIICENLKHLNNDACKKWVAQRNKRERIQEIYDFYINSPRTHEDGYFCYKLLVCPHL